MGPYLEANTQKQQNRRSDGIRFLHVTYFKESEI